MSSPRVHSSNQAITRSRDEIESIRARHPIEQVIAAYTDLHPAGRLLQAKCPLPGHEDTRPSFTVYTNNQSFYCFGCNRGGDVFKFIQLVERVSFREAVARLEGETFQAPQHARAAKANTISTLTRCVDEDAMRLLTAAAEVYHASLLLNPEMFSYVTGRGITLDTIKRFRLGYATGDNLAKYFRFRGWDLELGKELGLISEHGEYFRKRIIIPEWRNRSAVYLVGRKTEDYQRVKYLGLPGVPKPLYGLEGVYKRKEVFIAEGAFDMLTLLQWGYPAVALLGSHLKKEWADDLAFAKRIYVVTDSDAPGRASAQVLSRMFCQRAVILGPLSNAKDVNELAGEPNGERLFGDLVEEAKAMTQGSGSTSVKRVTTHGG